MNRDFLYIPLITAFFVWGLLGLISPNLHRRAARFAYIWMGVAGLLAVICVGLELFPDPEYLHFGFAQAFGITTGLALILLPIMVGEKSIVGYFSPFWSLVVTIGLTAAFIFPPQHKVLLANWTFELHFLLSMFSYASFTIWALIAVILIIQSNRLQRPQSVEQIKQLPPLLAIERQSIWMGRITLIILTAVLITGIIYSNISIGKILLNHKFIFALLTWTGVCIIIFGQIFRHWRGKWVNYAVLICYGFVFLAYIGYRFVLEIILKRGV